MKLNFSDMPQDMRGHDVVAGNLIIGVARYGAHYVREKVFMGYTQLPELDIEWEPR